jgi:DNA-binding transcriptional LysR family regulator
MGQPPQDMDLQAESLATQPLGILAAPGHRLAGEMDIPTAALAECDFVVREPGSGTRAAMDRFFHDAHIAPPRVMELSSNESIKQAVMGNMGLAFLSLHTAGLELQGKMLVVLDVVGLPLMRQWHVVSLGSGPMSDAAASLRRYIVEEGGVFIERQFNGLNLATNSARPAAALAN